MAVAIVGIVPSAAAADASITSVSFTSSTGPDGFYGIDDVVTLRADFDGPVSVEPMPTIQLNMYVPATGWTMLKMGSACYASGSGTSSLTFRYAVREGMSGYLKTNKMLTNLGPLTPWLGTGYIYVGGTDNTANVEFQSSAKDEAQQADGSRPERRSAETSSDGTQIVLAFSEDLSSVAAGVSDFTVTVDGSEADVTGVSASGRELTLTLDTAVYDGDAVRVSYTEPTAIDNGTHSDTDEYQYHVCGMDHAGDDANAIQDLVGNDARGFSGVSVVNRSTSTRSSINDKPKTKKKAVSSPLMASFQDKPGEHDGTTPFTFRIPFSEPITISYKTVRDSSLAATGGTVTGARRVDGRKDLWEIRLEPDDANDVTVTLAGGRACGTSGAVCTSAGKVLRGDTSLSVIGPPLLRVGDADTEEGADAELTFPVTLSRPSIAAVTFNYATKDVSATAVEDYVAASGTLTIPAGEIDASVTVEILDDGLDEGSETLILKLSTAAGAWLDRAEATGTISNTDPMPSAWLTRFGRAAADQAMSAVTGRLEERDTQSSANLGGLQRFLPIRSRDAALGGDPAMVGDPATPGNRALLGHWDSQAGSSAATGHWDSQAGSSAATGHWDSQAGSSAMNGVWDPAGDRVLHGNVGSLRPDEATGHASRLPDAATLLSGSSFMWSPELGPSGGWAENLTLWGRGSAMRFDGREEELSLQGDMLTGTLGMDYELGRLTGGVAVSHAVGDGAFSAPELGSRGQVESSLTSVLPYLRVSLNERLDAWGLLGYGRGGLQLLDEGLGRATAIDTGIGARMGAVGLRGDLWRGQRFGLAARTDALWSQTTSEATEQVVATAGATSRVRMVLEGSGRFAFGSGRTLMPSVELGLRNDAGDAEVGMGLEVGAGLGYQDAARGFSIEGRARALLAHEDRDYREWGASATIQVNPGGSGRGLGLSLTPSWGAVSSGVERLWSMPDTGGLARRDVRDPQARMSAVMGYGVYAPRLAGDLTPFVQLDTSGDDSRRYRSGLAFEHRFGRLSAELGVEREERDAEASRHGIDLRFQMPFGARSAPRSASPSAVQSVEPTAGATQAVEAGAAAESVSDDDPTVQ